MSDPTTPAVTSSQARSAWVLNCFRAALGGYLVSVPFVFGYRYDATTINLIICGLLVFVPVLLSRRFPAARFAHIPLALWLGSSVFIFKAHDGALYSAVIVAKMLIISAIGSPEIFED